MSSPVRPAAAALSLGIVLLLTPAAAAQVSLTGMHVTCTESFNSLAGTGPTGSVLPAGWQFAEVGSLANTTYGISDGSVSTPNTYSFGSAGSSDRAFGALGSTGTGGLATTIGASFVNDTGVPLAGVRIAYRGEQWWRGSGNAPDRFDFAYSADATSLTSGTWIDVDALDFTSPVTGTPKNRSLDGNAAGNFTNIAGQITFATPIAPGGTFFVRWVDFNSTAAEDGLAIDNFALTPTPEPGTVLALAALVLGAVAYARRPRKPATA